MLMGPGACDRGLRVGHTARRLIIIRRKELVLVLCGA